MIKSSLTDGRTDGSKLETVIKTATEMESVVKIGQITPQGMCGRGEDLFEWKPKIEAEGGTSLTYRTRLSLPLFKLPKLQGLDVNALSMPLGDHGRTEVLTNLSVLTTRRRGISHHFPTPHATIKSTLNFNVGKDWPVQHLGERWLNVRRLVAVGAVGVSNLRIPTLFYSPSHNFESSLISSFFISYLLRLPGTFVLLVPFLRQHRHGDTKRSDHFVSARKITLSRRSTVCHSK